MDFTRENLHDRLADAGVDIHLRTLFLWEGVVYYLPEASVRETLQILSGAARGSSLVFDYVMHDVIAHPDKHYGASGFLSYVARKGEPVLFGIAPQSLCAFLDGYGYRVQSHLGPAQLCNQYLVTTNAAKTDPVCDIFEIVCATRA
jgi:methyltransferase (TIGR00027 family)